MSTEALIKCFIVQNLRLGSVGGGGGHEIRDKKIRATSLSPNRKVSDADIQVVAFRYRSDVNKKAVLVDKRTLTDSGHKACQQD